MSDTTQTINLEKRLEEVHVALIEGNFALATELLPEVLEHGDELQRQIAESYLLQIDMLLDEEANANAAEEDIPEGLIAGDDDEEDAILGWDDEEEPAGTVDGDHEIAEPLDDAIDIVTATNEAVNEVAYDETTTIQQASEIAHHTTDRTAEDAEHDTTHTSETAIIEESTEILTDTSEVHAISSSAYDLASEAIAIVTENTEDDSDTLDSDTLSEITSDEDEEATIDPALEHEIDIALAQVAVLIADDELETAEFLIKKALTEGTPKQQHAAQQYQQIIAHTQLIHADSSNNETHIISVTDDGLGDNDEDASFADDVFDIPEEDFDDWQAALDALDNDSDNIDSDSTYGDKDDTVTRTHTETLDNDTDSDDARVSYDAHNAWDDEPSSSRDTSDTHSQTGSAIASETTASNDAIDDDTGATVWQSIADSFENDNTEGLLAPSVLLDGFDGTMAQSGQAIDSPTVQQAMFNALPQSALSTDINSTLTWSPSKASTAKQRQGFTVGGINLMIDFASGTELSKLPTYYRIPNSPTWLIGLTNMHGIVIPVFDLLGFLNVKPMDTKTKKMLLVLEHEEKAVGIIIEGLPRRLVWYETDNVANNTAPSALKEHIHAACLINDELWFDLNVDSLCNALANRLTHAH